MTDLVVKERYSPVVMAANSSTKVNAIQLGGFLAVTTGFITVVRNNDDGTTTTIINAAPVTAGIYLPLPFYTGFHGATVTLTGGASGTLAV